MQNADGIMLIFICQLALREWIELQESVHWNPILSVTQKCTTYPQEEQITDYQSWAVVSQLAAFQIFCATFSLDSIVQLILVRIHKPTTLRYREVFCRAFLRMMYI